MSKAFSLTSCISGLASESSLSRSPETQYGFVPKLSHHGGKTSRFALKNRFEIGTAMSSIKIIKWFLLFFL